MNKRELNKVPLSLPEINGRRKTIQFIGDMVVANIFYDRRVLWREFTTEDDYIRQIFDANGRYRWQSSLLGKTRSYPVREEDFECSPEEVREAAQRLSLTENTVIYYDRAELDNEQSYAYDDKIRMLNCEGYLKKCCEEKSNPSLLYVLHASQSMTKKRRILNSEDATRQEITELEEKIGFDTEDFERCIREHFGVKRFQYTHKKAGKYFGSCSECLSEYAVDPQSTELDYRKVIGKQTTIRCPKCGKVIRLIKHKTDCTTEFLSQYNKMIYARRCDNLMIFNMFNIRRKYDPLVPGYFSFDWEDPRNYVVIDIYANTVKIFRKNSLEGWRKLDPWKSRDWFGIGGNGFAKNSNEHAEMYGIRSSAENIIAALDAPQFKFFRNSLMMEKEKLSQHPVEYFQRLKNYVYIPAVRTMYRNAATSYLNDAEFINKDKGKSYHQLLQINSSEQNFILKNDMSYHEVKFYDFARNCGYSFGQKELKLIRNCISDKSLDIAARSIKEYPMTVSGYFGYIEKASESIGNSFDETMALLRDTRRMAQQLEHDLTDPVIMLPLHRELEHIHDRYVYEINSLAIKEDVERNKKVDADIRGRFSELNKRYTSKSDRFIVFPIPNFKFIVDEGISQSNCVRSYAESYAMGNCDLLVVRNRHNISKSLLTVEVRGENVTQARGYDNEINGTMEREALEYLKGYCNQKKLQCSPYMAS